MRAICGDWRLLGLVRGGAGTESAAIQGHDAGTNVVLLDEKVTLLEPALAPVSTEVRIASIGLADEEPVFADLENIGLSRRPLMPTAPQTRIELDGDWRFCWTRRARGQ